uniref:Uncharacterized protein n=1 Tax=Setaria digitata TaxID=48799 RepID=A0A915PXD5_9BILA
MANGQQSDESLGSAPKFLFIQLKPRNRRNSIIHADGYRLISDGEEVTAVQREKGTKRDETKRTNGLFIFIWLQLQEKRGW